MIRGMALLDAFGLNKSGKADQTHLKVIGNFEVINLKTYENNTADYLVRFTDDGKSAEGDFEVIVKSHDRSQSFWRIIGAALGEHYDEK